MLYQTCPLRNVNWLNILEHLPILLVLALFNYWQQCFSRIHFLLLQNVMKFRFNDKSFCESTFTSDHSIPNYYINPMPAVDHVTCLIGNSYRSQSRSTVHGTDTSNHETHRCTRQRTVMWPAVERSWQRNHGMGWKRPRCELHIRIRSSRQVPT